MLRLHHLNKEMMQPLSDATRIMPSLWQWLSIFFIVNGHLREERGRLRQQLLIVCAAIMDYHQR